MNLIKSIGIASTLVVSTGANAFGLGDALSTVNEVSKTVNQLSTPQVVPTPAVQPTPTAQPIKNSSPTSNLATQNGDSSTPENCDNPFLNTIIANNHKNREYKTELVTCKKIPTNPNLSIFVIPLITQQNEEGNSVFDLDIVVADTSTGTIVSNLFKENALVSDAMEITNITIDTAAYQLNENDRAFGVKINSYHRGGESVNSDILSLYTFNTQLLHPIIPTIEVESSISSQMTSCDADAHSIKRFISILPTKTDDFYDILVNEKGTKNVQSKKSCKETKKNTQYKLKYSAKIGAYDVPKEIQGVYPSP